MAQPAYLFTWQKAFSSKYGPSATTRLVLHTLGIHMDKNGGSCFPSTRTLAIESGSSERSVCTHLEFAENTGWITRNARSGSGQGWKLNSYQASIPKKVLKEIQHLEYEGAERDSARLTKGTEPLSEGTESNDKNVLNEVQPSRSNNRTKSFYSFPLKDSSEFIVDEDLFAELAKAYPDVDRILRYSRIGGLVLTTEAWCDEAIRANEVVDADTFLVRRRLGLEGK